MAHLQYFNYEGFGDRSRVDVHYSQAVRIGDIIDISGQGGWDRITEKISSDIGEEIDQAFDNVEHTLQKAGGKGWSEVYKIRAYAAPIKDEMLGHLVRNLRKYCPNHQPALTYIGVEKLALEGMRIEIEVLAQITE